MSTVSEIVSSIVVGICVCTGIVFVGSWAIKMVEAPEVCAASVIKLDNMNGSSASCHDGAKAEKPEKVKIDGDDVMIVRCTCTDNPVVLNHDVAMDDDSLTTPIEAVDDVKGKAEEVVDEFLQ